MKTITKVLFSLLLLAPATILRAQQDPQFTQYMFNRLFFNPAYAGMEGTGNAGLIFREQWAGWSSTYDNGGAGAPTSALLHFNAPFQKYQSGIGFTMLFDQLGAQSNLQAMLSYSYHLEVGEGKLGIGIAGGVAGQGIDFDLFQPLEADDPALNGSSDNEYKPDADFGLWYQTEDYFGGVSVKHLFESSYDFRTPGQTNVTSLARHYYITGGYNFRRFVNFVLTPQLIYRNDGSTGTVDVSFTGTYEYNRREFFGGLGYRFQESLSLIAGMGLTKGNDLRLSYAFDIVTSAVEAKAATSHEVMLNYRIPIVFKPSKPVIRTPRYRK